MHAFATKKKTIATQGEVSDRTSFFVVVKFYKLTDRASELIVVTRRTFPALRSTVRKKGRIDEAFPIGDQKMPVFAE